MLPLSQHLYALTQPPAYQLSILVILIVLVGYDDTGMCCTSGHAGYPMIFLDLLGHLRLSVTAGTPAVGHELGYRTMQSVWRLRSIIWGCKMVCGRLRLIRVWIVSMCQIYDCWCASMCTTSTEFVNNWLADQRGYVELTRWVVTDASCLVLLIRLCFVVQRYASELISNRDIGKVHAVKLSKCHDVGHIILIVVIRTTPASYMIIFTLVYSIFHKIWVNIFIFITILLIITLRIIISPIFIPILLILSFIPVTLHHLIHHATMR